MFRRLLIPLDGSKMAEQVFPAARQLAQTFSAEVILLHVLEAGGKSQVHGEHHLTHLTEATTYLENVAKEAFAGIQVRVHVHEEKIRDVARGIAEHQAELQHDLVLMCSHGRPRLTQLFSGTLGQQIAGCGSDPVLLIRPTAPGTTPTFRRLLLPLDGHPGHEASIPVAMQFARAFGAEVFLLRVAPTPETLSGDRALLGRFLPGATRAILDLDAEESQSYLADLKNRFEAEGLQVRTGVARGQPVEAILKLAAEWHPDLLILGTHGKAGAAAFWTGSVAPGVAEKATSSFLLVPAK